MKPQQNSPRIKHEAKMGRRAAGSIRQDIPHENMVDEMHGQQNAQFVRGDQPAYGRRARPADQMLTPRRSQSQQNMSSYIAPAPQPYPSNLAYPSQGQYPQLPNSAPDFYSYEGGPYANEPVAMLPTDQYRNIQYQPQNGGYYPQGGFVQASNPNQNYDGYLYDDPYNMPNHNQSAYYGGMHDNQYGHIQSSNSPYDDEMYYQQGGYPTEGHYPIQVNESAQPYTQFAQNQPFSMAAMPNSARRAPVAMSVESSSPRHPSMPRGPREVSKGSKQSQKEYNPSHGRRQKQFNPTPHDQQTERDSKDGKDPVQSRRPIVYKPISVNEFKEKYPEHKKKYVELGKLGPDLGSEELQRKKAILEKRKDYSRNLRKLAHVPSEEEKKVIEEKRSKEKLERAQGRLKALEYANQVRERKPGISPSVQGDDRSSVGYYYPEEADQYYEDEYGQPYEDDDEVQDNEDQQDDVLDEEEERLQQQLQQLELKHRNARENVRALKEYVK
eukprot:TRINITY_DN5173_c0_g1_i1.p1 TRINITY_DN5173_c0_g1~~TRINITY_DN5173_c0_g1_i1.p1  ORF type:complete len:498 (+),score=109.72 TRINITY_DN5173_c0_g1_i1:798-2291(+)